MERIGKLHRWDVYLVGENGLIFRDSKETVCIHIDDLEQFLYERRERNRSKAHGQPTPTAPGEKP